MGPESHEAAGKTPKKASNVLISFEQALTNMSAGEKAQFEQLRADYIKALDMCKPVLIKLGQKRQEIMDSILKIDLELLGRTGLTSYAIATRSPWKLVTATLGNLSTTVKAITINMEHASADELDAYANELERAADKFKKRFYDFQNEMRKKYTTPSNDFLNA